MFQGLKKRPTFEELIQDLQNFDKLIKYPNRKATRIKEWVDMLNLNIYQINQNQIPLLVLLQEDLEEVNNNII